MQNVLKFAVPGCLLAAIVIVACTSHFNTTKATFTASRSNEAFERGKNLTYNICGQCHYNKDAGKFIGMQMHEIPSLLGKVYSANLTNSKSNGLPPHYTDAELQYLLKTGIAKDGRFLSYMLRPNLSDNDINDIIVYLRSDDPAVAAADTTVGKTHLNPIGKIAMSATGKPVAYRIGVKRPAESDAVATGRYLIDIIGCYHCHSKSLTSLNYLHPEQSKGYLAGGYKFKDPAGMKVYASNLTPDKETGIGKYSRDDFRKAVREGIAPRGQLHPPMPKFTHLTDGQADAIYAYLQTVPPVQHKVDDH
jgi:mono/diheme cytochrome c family protein